MILIISPASQKCFGRYVTVRSIFTLLKDSDFYQNYFCLRAKNSARVSDTFTGGSDEPPVNFYAGFQQTKAFFGQTAAQVPQETQSS